MLVLLLPAFAYARPGYFEPWGRDADLKHEAPRAPEVKSERSLGVKIAERIIHFHQNVISPVDGPRSHFIPSSSGYMLQSMQKHGFIWGFFMGCDRLMRENSDDWVYRKIEVNGKLIKYDPIR